MERSFTPPLTADDESDESDEELDELPRTCSDKVLRLTRPELERTGDVGEPGEVAGGGVFCHQQSSGLRVQGEFGGAAEPVLVLLIFGG